MRTVIYPAHGLYQNINVIFAGQAVEVNALLFVVSVNNALVFLIYKYIRSVGEAVKIELAAVFSDEMMMIADKAEVLTEMLHAFGAYALVLFAESLNVIDKCGVFCELDVSHCLAERFLRKLCFGERLSTQKLLADGIIFIRVAALVIRPGILSFTPKGIILPVIQHPVEKENRDMRQLHFIGLTLGVCSRYIFRIIQRFLPGSIK